MCALSTTLSNFVTDSILQHEDAKKRAALLRQWIKVAESCRDLRNYNALMAILAGLNSSTINRLKKTWAVLPDRVRAQYETLVDLMDCKRNYSNYRARLKEDAVPCLPYVGLYRRDLTFVEEGNRDFRELVDRGRVIQLVNFDKQTKTARIICELQRFQVPYNLVEVPELRGWLRSEFERVRATYASDESVLYRRSLFLEPRS
jgi:hypothetical protein